MNFDPGSPFGSFNNHGATGGFTYNVGRVLGLTSELGQYHFNRDVGGSPVKGGQTSYLFGPRVNWRRFDYFVPFAQFLIGGAHGGLAVTGDRRQNTFALAAGGGVDMVLTKRLALRGAPVDYLMTEYCGSSRGPKGCQHNVRVGN